MQLQMKQNQDSVLGNLDLKENRPGWLISNDRIGLSSVFLKWKLITDQTVLAQDFSGHIHPVLPKDLQISLFMLATLGSQSAYDNPRYATSNLKHRNWQDFLPKVLSTNLHWRCQTPFICRLKETGMIMSLHIEQLSLWTSHTQQRTDNIQDYNPGVFCLQNVCLFACFTTTWKPPCCFKPAPKWFTRQLKKAVK